MTPNPRTENEKGSGGGLWLEPIIALLMALVTLCTAWCSYESASWTRRGNRLINDANALERQAGLLTINGLQVATIHTGLFSQVVAAQGAGNPKLVDFYVKRFPPDLRKAFDAWMAQNPSQNPNADPHPFVPALYELQGAKEAAEATAKATVLLKESRAAGNVSGEYLANTVLFACVLFFASATGKFKQTRVRWPAFIFAATVFAIAIARTLTLPV